MGQAILHGLLRAGHPPQRLSAADPNGETREKLRKLHTALFVSAENGAVTYNAEILVLAVKPQNVKMVCEQLRELDRARNQLIMSIAAGITMSSLRSWLSGDDPMVRVMPNQPALIGAGVSVLAANNEANESSRKNAEYITNAIGESVWLEDESLMDAATAISGSGPAYFYLLMEIVEAAAIAFGFTESMARRLTVGTALGAAQLAEQEGVDLKELGASVTSPGGTTAAALTVLEDEHVRDIFSRALEAARNRAEELGRTTDSD